MTARHTPHPFPIGLLDQVNADLQAAKITDPDVRYTIRRMVADAYAEGFDDGHSAGHWNAQRDRRDQDDAS